MGVNVPASWTQTMLWTKLLERNDAESKNARLLIDLWMPKIETVLANGGTSPLDFTLHDAGHSYRVAGRMCEIIPSDVLPGLSSYELALLLFSAYLHDIGMTPERRLVSRHYKYLLSGDSSGLSKEEIEEFQEWLDAQQRAVASPLCSASPTPAQIKLCELLITHYSRARHNDWSAQWISENAPKEALLYSTWTQDLIQLCRSHHYDKNDLMEPFFNPKIVGPVGSVVHLRYLACVLRIADILEFDPERTPDVILRHRDISEGSAIYWHKDHAISFKKEGEGLIVSARPSSAILHRAIDEMLDEIDYELALCRTLDEDTHFEMASGQKHLVHRWSLPAYIHRDVRPLPNTYEYINGAFRPDTDRLLQLFAGTEMYGQPIAAVRELLQNAFDAVREQIAYERLAGPDPSSEARAEAVATQHRVELRLEQRGDDFWLSCRDDGVGMTKSIIEKHLLISGQARKRDIISLERKCRDSGFKLERTGQFGVGVLSYFMLADEVKIETRRSLEPGDSESSGWEFTTSGVGSFGELRPLASLNQHGTRIELKLRRDDNQNSIISYESIRQYLVETLVRLPCEFQLTSSLPGSDALQMSPGWNGEKYLFETALAESRIQHAGVEAQLEIELLPQSEKEAVQAQERAKELLTESLRNLVRWDTGAGNLPGGLGRYQFRIPYFQLPAGNSLVYLSVEEKPGSLILRSTVRGYFKALNFRLRFSWKGMASAPSRNFSAIHHRLNVEDPTRGSVLIQVDFTSPEAGILHVNRSSFSLSAAGAEAIRWLWGQVAVHRSRLACEFKDSPFSAINKKISGAHDLRIPKPRWTRVEKNERTGKIIHWDAITFPVTTSMPWAYMSYPQNLKWRGKPLQVLECIRATADDDHYKGLAWVGTDGAPDYIGVHNEWYRPLPIPIWVRNPLNDKTPSGPLLKSQFPPEWKHIMGVSFDKYSENSAVIWNKANPIVRLVHPDDLIWAVTAVSSRQDPLLIKEAITSSRSKAAAIVMAFAKSGEWALWDGLKERDPDFLPNVWKLMFGKRQESWSRAYLVMSDTNFRIRAVSPDGWTAIKETKEVAKIFPTPTVAWQISGHRTHDSRPRFRRSS